MDTNKIVEKLHTLLFTKLKLESPVLSGNMRGSINLGSISESTREIIINAPFYDMKKWKKTGVITRTGETIYGKTDYAKWVNDLGGFATHNKSENWVNRACVEIATIIANEVGGIVINELEL